MKREEYKSHGFSDDRNQDARRDWQGRERGSKRSWVRGLALKGLFSRKSSPSSLSQLRLNTMFQQLTASPRLQ